MCGPGRFHQQPREGVGSALVRRCVVAVVDGNGGMRGVETTNTRMVRSFLTTKRVQALNFRGV